MEFYVARSVSAGSVDAEDVVSDDVTVSGSAFSGGDARSGYLHEDIRDALQDTVSGLTPSADQKGISNVSGLGGWC